MTLEYKRHPQFPLRLPPSLRQRATELALAEGVSLTVFISQAVTEKIERMQFRHLEENDR
ncbi:YlcI/YnfO family protein [Tunturibacter empetritectus]|uniref:YlcI/YnfO family protein n=1 Tax=Tunturiibacter empetritectus TaxID=3069691 RepID=UPI0015CA5E0A